MNQRQYELLKIEFNAAIDRAQSRLHPAWAEVAREYQFSTADDMFQFAIQNVSPNLMGAMLATDGRMPSMQIIGRKYVSRITSMDPDFSLENEKPDLEAMAWLLEESLKDTLRRIKYSEREEEWALDAFLFGTAISKVSYSSEFVHGEEAYIGDVARNSDVDLSDDLQWPTGMLTEFTNQNVSPGDVYCGRVAPWDFFTDPGCLSHQDARRYYVRYLRPVVDIHRDVRYNSAAAAQVRGKVVWEDRNTAFFEQFDEYTAECSRAYVVECFDIASGKFCIFSPEADEPLIDWKPFPISNMKHPYSFFRPIQGNSFWGIPLAFLLLPSIRAKNQIRGTVMNQISEDGKKVGLCSSQTVQSEDIERIIAARNGDIIPIEGLPTGADANTWLQWIEFNGASPHLTNLIAEFARDEQIISGLDDPSLNVYRGKEMSATEVNARQSATGDNMQFFRKRFEAFQRDTVQNLCQVHLQYWDPERLVRVVGQDPRMEFWIPVERSRVSDDFRIKIHPGTAEKRDSVTYRMQIAELAPRIAEWKQIVDMDAQMAQQGFQSPIDALEILKTIIGSVDRRLVDKIVRTKDPATMLRRLIEQYGLTPTYVSPELKQYLQMTSQTVNNPAGQQQMAMTPAPWDMQQMQPPNMVPFEQQNGVPAPSNMNPMAQFQQNSGGAMASMLGGMGGAM